MSTRTFPQEDFIKALPLIPSPMTSQVLTDYLDKREKLIAADRALRVDCVRRANDTTAELRADEVVRAIRAREAVSVWGAEHDDVPHPYTGMEFLNGMDNRILFTIDISHKTTARDIILKTDLYSKIVSKVSMIHLRVSLDSFLPCL